MSETQESSRPRRYRRRLLVAAAAVAVLIVGWQAFEYMLDLDRFQPMIVQELEKALGLPASVGKVDLRLAPTPRVDVRDVVVGKEDFRAESPCVSVWPRIAPLLYGELDVARVRPRGAVVTLPKDPAEVKHRIEAFSKTLGKGGGGGGRVTVAEHALELASYIAAAEHAPDHPARTRILDPIGQRALGVAAGLEPVEMIPASERAVNGNITELTWNFDIVILGQPLQAHRANG